MINITRTLLRTARPCTARSAIGTRLFNTSASVCTPEQPAAAGSVSVSQEDFDSLKLSYKKLKSISRSLSRNELSATFADENADEQVEEKSLGDVIPSRFVGVSDCAADTSGQGPLLLHTMKLLIQSIAICSDRCSRLPYPRSSQLAAAGRVPPSSPTGGDTRRPSSLSSSSQEQVTVSLCAQGTQHTWR